MQSLRWLSIFCTLSAAVMSTFWVLIASAEYDDNPKTCDAVIDLEWADWPTTRARFDEILSEMQRLNDQLTKRNQHCRINGNLISKGKSREQLTAVFEEIDRKETEAAISILYMLNGKNGYPRFDVHSANNPDSIGFYNLENDLITIAREQHSPTISVLLHLLGRWGYVNILRPQDRQSYWESLSKYYDRNRLERSKLRPLLPWQQYVVDDDNLLEGPDEFFAYQFEMWAWQTRMPEHFQSGKFWRKNTLEYDRSLRYRMMEAKRLDPDLDKLFSRIFHPTP